VSKWGRRKDTNKAYPKGAAPISNKGKYYVIAPPTQMHQADRYMLAEKQINNWISKMPKEDNQEYVYHTTFSDLDSIKDKGLIINTEKTFEGYGVDKIYLAPDLDAVRYWSEMGFWRNYDKGNISEPKILRVKKTDVSGLSPSIRRDEITSGEIEPKHLEKWCPDTQRWERI